MSKKTILEYLDAIANGDAVDEEFDYLCDADLAGVLDSPPKGLTEKALRWKERSGFTLIELIIVVVVLGLLAIVGVGIFMAFNVDWSSLLSSGCVNCGCS